MDSMSLLSNLIYFIGLLTIAIGLLASLLPFKMAKQYGIKLDTKFKNDPIIGFVISTGARDLFMGATLILANYRKDTFLIAGILFLLSFIALIDFLNVYKYGDKKTSIIHLLGSLLCLFLGIVRHNYF